MDEENNEGMTMVTMEVVLVNFVHGVFFLLGGEIGRGGKRKMLGDGDAVSWIY